MENGGRQQSCRDKGVYQTEFGNEDCARAASAILYSPPSILAAATYGSRSDYFFAAASCLTFVWKIASQSFPSFFQTVPALKVPEASLPSYIPSSFTT